MKAQTELGAEMVGWMQPWRLSPTPPSPCVLAVQRKRVVPLMITCTPCTAPRPGVPCPSRPLFAQTEEATPRYPLE
ncbi:MAG: hypothetical protein ACK53Y_24170, partial [bacterium]